MVMVVSLQARWPNAQHNVLYVALKFPRLTSIADLSPQSPASANFLQDIQAISWIAARLPPASPRLALCPVAAHEGSRLPSDSLLVMLSIPLQVLAKQSSI